MASATPRARRSLAHDPRLAWALAALFFTVGVALIRTDRFLHDEGLLSWFFAGILADEPIATLFFLKARPPLALLYAPISGLGLDVFLWLHVLVAALAIPLMAAVARALGQGAPNLVALALAASPMMLAAAPSGVGNTDAITGLALALYLLVARRSPAAAGLVAGALPLVRAEITIYVLALALYCLPRARRRFLYALPAVGLALALAGALYHQDVLWFIHYPPTLTSPGQDTPAFGEHGYAQASLGQTAGALLSIAPLLGLLALLPWRALHPLERALLLAGLAFGLAIRGLPFTGLFHFDDSPRYALPLIMMMAPLGRLATTEAEGRGWPAAALYVALLVVGDAIDRAEGSRLLLAAIAGWALVWALLRRARPRLSLALASALALAAAAAPQLYEATRLASDDYARSHAVFARWVEEHPARARESRIITNIHLLSTWSRRQGLFEAGVTIDHIVSRDIEEELRTLVNQENGQYEALLDALRRHFYGRPLAADALRPELLEGDVIFVIHADERLERVMPRDQWAPLMTTLVEEDGVRIAAFTPPASPRDR